jgi:putative transposase
MSIDKDLLDRLMEGRSAADLFGKDGVLSELTKALAERALSAGLDDHLTGERADPPPEGRDQEPNRRNGSSQKTVTTDSGKVVLDIPRDRNGSFDPMLIAKYQRRFPEFDSKIISMYARGMTTREIQRHIEEIYGVEASPSLISAITDAVMEEVTAWSEPPAGALLSGGLHGRDPGQHPQRWGGVEQGGLRGPDHPAGRDARCAGAVVPGQ